MPIVEHHRKPGGKWRLPVVEVVLVDHTPDGAGAIDEVAGFCRILDAASKSSDLTDSERSLLNVLRTFITE